MKGVIYFINKGKLRPRCIRPFEILDKVGGVAYRLALPPNMASVHNVFYLHRLRKYMADPIHILCHVVLDIELEPTYEEKPF